MLVGVGGREETEALLEAAFSAWFTPVRSCRDMKR
jgi:hypothetical protein